MVRKVLRIAIVTTGVLVALGAGATIALSAASLKPYEEDFAEPNNEPPEKGSIRVTFYGATNLVFDDGKTRVMIDGFFSRPSLPIIAMHRKIETDEDVMKKLLEHEPISRLDAILVSHSHYDHALDVADLANRTGAELHGSISTCNIGRGGKVPEEKLKCFGTDVRSEFFVGVFHITVLPSKHSPAIGTISSSH